MATATVSFYPALYFYPFALNLSDTFQVDNPSYTSTAVETYQLDVESTALVS
jgi:hypothetical protein